MATPRLRRGHSASRRRRGDDADVRSRPARFCRYGVLGLVTAIIVVCTAFYNGFVLFKFPDYEKSVRLTDLGAA